MPRNPVEPSPTGAAAQLNESCHCTTVDPLKLEAALRRDGADLELATLATTHPHLFATTPVFATQADLAAMAEVVRAVERVIHLPGYAALALADVPAIARSPVRSRGAFLGFDFHASAAGPQLIEINTNAGGALVNIALRGAQIACCPELEQANRERTDELRLLEMLRSEWTLARGTRALGSIAIVDDAPETQYLAPEQRLYEKLFEAHGYRARIVDARALEIEGGRLVHGGEPIDLVYNRTTDFYFEAPEHAALARAFAEDLAVVLPNPRDHAIYADKRRLILLSDARALEQLGASEADVRTFLSHVPLTQLVRAQDAESLWAARKRLFFKPVAGYGSKAAYRGDKLTHGTFEHILSEPYVAQALVTPSTRSVQVGDEARTLRLDLRNFAYAGEVQLVCARLYTGQTTNFRTEGGGFAPVFAA